MPGASLPFHAILRRVGLPALVLVLSATPARADLMLSELCDPRLNYTTDRLIQIHNSGNAPVDLTGWKVEAIGNSNVIESWELSGVIDPHDAMGCGDDAPAVAFTVDFPKASRDASNGTWNGNINDGARLVNPSLQVVDFIKTTTDGVFRDASLVRNSDITAPSPVHVAQAGARTLSPNRETRR